MRRPLRASRRPAAFATAAATATVLTVGLTLGVVPGSADAATIYIPPVRSIGGATAGTPLMALADNGTLYVAQSGDLEVWAPDSDGAGPHVLKTFTGLHSDGQPSFSPSRGVAYVDSTAHDVRVMDPAQPSGAVVATRTIAGAATTLDEPVAATWTKDGSLWVVDTQPTIDLLRFAPGADGDVAPVKKISGPRTRLDVQNPLAAGAFLLAPLPGNGVAVAEIGFQPGALVFTGSQSGNVKPARRLRMESGGLNWLSEGLASDAAGRLYIGAGSPSGSQFGRLDVFAPNADGFAQPLISLGGPKQSLQVPALMTTSPNGQLAFLDLHIVDLGGSTFQFGDVQVFKPLFTKPGKVKGLKAAKKGKNAVITWKAGANPSGTPVSYKVTIKKGKKTKLSKTTTARSLKVKRSALPKGKLKVTVVATNVGGKSGAANKTFTNR